MIKRFIGRLVHDELAKFLGSLGSDKHKLTEQLTMMSLAIKRTDDAVARIELLAHKLESLNIQQPSEAEVQKPKKASKK